MWGLRDLREMHARDGKLFQSEMPRRLFGDVKRVLLESLNSLRETMGDNRQGYLEGLDHCRRWHPVVAREEMKHAMDWFPDLQLRVQAVAALYARMLYSEQYKLLGEPLPKKALKMHRPQAETLLRGFFERACSSSWIRDESFWEMDPFQRDYFLRDAFRDALAQDCVKVTIIHEDLGSSSTNFASNAQHAEEAVPVSKHAAEVDAPKAAVVAEVVKQTQNEKAPMFSYSEDAPASTEDDDALITADDSISTVMEKVRDNLQTESLPDKIPLILDWSSNGAFGQTKNSSEVVPSNVSNEVLAPEAPTIDQSQITSQPENHIDSSAPSVVTIRDSQKEVANTIASKKEELLQQVQVQEQEQAPTIHHESAAESSADVASVAGSSAGTYISHVTKGPITVRLGEP